MDQLTSQEKAAKITWFLALGEELSNERIGVLTGLSRQGVYVMMSKLARVLPIARDLGTWSASSLVSD